MGGASLSLASFGGASRSDHTWSCEGRVSRARILITSLGILATVNGDRRTE
jgi:hypothetical protein